MAQQHATMTKQPNEPLSAITEDRAPHNVQDTASKLAEQARQYAGKAQQAAQELKPFVERSLKDQPMATLAGAAVVGFLLGALCVA